MLTRTRIKVILGGTALLLAWVVADLLTEVPVLLLGLPVFGAIWFLVMLDGAYLLGRERLHRRRRRASQVRRDAWTPEPSVRKPIDYPGIVPQPVVSDPIDRQGRFRATGIRLAVLPVLAVSFLTAQALLLEHAGALALGFVFAECLLLVVMVWTVWSKQQPSRSWVTSRTRADVFRREMFLLLVGVGPYLGLADEPAQAVRDARMNLLANADPARLTRFTYLTDEKADGTETHWQDEVWRAGLAPADADTVERMRTYLDYRIRKQSLFFVLAAEKGERTDSSLGWIVKGTILAGVVVALSYAVLLASTPDREGLSTPAAVIALLAAGIPPLCNSALAIQNLFASQRLAASYLETRQELIMHENTLCKLLREPTAPGTATSFRALALHVEATLAEEHRRWRVIVAKPEFEAGL